MGVVNALLDDLTDDASTSSAHASRFNTSSVVDDDDRPLVTRAAPSRRKHAPRVAAPQAPNRVAPQAPGTVSAAAGSSAVESRAETASMTTSATTTTTSTTAAATTTATTATTSSIATATTAAAVNASKLNEPARAGQDDAPTQLRHASVLEAYIACLEEAAVVRDAVGASCRRADAQLARDPAALSAARAEARDALSRVDEALDASDSRLTQLSGSIIALESRLQTLKRRRRPAPILADAAAISTLIAVALLFVWFTLGRFVSSMIVFVKTIVWS